jgi:hypothetical protein
MGQFGPSPGLGPSWRVDSGLVADRESHDIGGSGTPAALGGKRTGSCGSSSSCPPSRNGSRLAWPTRSRTAAESACLTRSDFRVLPDGGVDLLVHRVGGLRPAVRAGYGPPHAGEQEPGAGGPEDHEQPGRLHRVDHHEPACGDGPGGDREDVQGHEAAHAERVRVVRRHAGRYRQDERHHDVRCAPSNQGTGRAATGHTKAVERPSSTLPPCFPTTAARLICDVTVRGLPASGAVRSSDP